MSDKICPHCKAALQPSQGAFELVKRGMTNADFSPGIPISVYSCPQCGYMELYNLKITARL
ncbi:MAG: hypothetical protein HY529_05655 [Chloroflexi bacterium]|nr:hypothetical protein [Chloroflexota bacterium]